MEISVAIVEDDKFYNDSLKKVLDYHPNLHCVGQFYSGKNAKEGLPKLLPDIVLMDLQLKDLMGYDIISDLKPAMPETGFIVCSNFEDEEKIFDSLKAGAIGYLIKGESMDKIVNSIIDAYNGSSPMSDGIARKVLRFFQNQNEKKVNIQSLTNTENDILNLLAKGLLYKEISTEKNISIETVKKHISNIYRKLGVNNKIEAINKLNHQ